ncbi:hypothetical protein [Rhodobacter maris]|uniref:Uncharacterized protein n=1 Tax=Rhodobacter maris TaxID=446682 RepID=A0A285TEB1_9RHOB|nr:hypothetical protein [Rhodobacter maris]SOC20584.1 hypothetical protein SAMN05877831_1203 [Rhodobacter maris]
MYTFDATTAAHFASRGPTRAHVLIWVSARNRTTGATETIGFWTGEDHARFDIDGEERIYYGAGATLSIDPIVLQTGLSVRTQRAALSQVSPEVQMAIRGYDSRHAPIEIHRALFDPVSGLLLAPPHLKLRGYIDRLNVKTPAEGGEGSIEVSIATAAKALTKALSRKRSDESLKARAAGDQFRKYASITDPVDTKWGTK